MPPATSRANHNGAATSRTNLQRVSDSLGFEELALCTLQALHPERQLQLGDIKMSRVRRLIKQLVSGQMPKKPVKHFDFPTIPLSPPIRKASRATRPMPKIEEEETKPEIIRRCSNASPTRRKISLGSSVDSQDSGEPETVERQPQSQLEQLIDCSLDKQTTLESFGALKRELAQLFKSERTAHAQNKKQLHFLDTQLLRSEIDSRRSPQKNIQCIEIHVLIELHKLRLLRELHQSNNLDKHCKAISKLRFLNVITGGRHLINFMRETMDQEFALSIPDQLKLVHERMCVDMPDEGLQFLTCSTTTDSLFPSRRLSKSGTNLTVDTPSSIESTPRNRSNSTPQSSSSAVSGFDEEDGFPTLEKMASLGSPPSSPIALKGNVLEDLKENSSRLNKQSRRRKTSSSSNGSEAKISTRRTTLNTDDDPPPLLSPAAGSFHLPTIDQEDEFEPPTLSTIANRRTSRPTLKRKISVKEEESSEVVSRRTSTASKTTTKVPLRVDARGSIGSRCQSNRRLCVIRQHTNDLMPTSRRSSTASLLQKQQQQKQQSVQRRSSYFERLALEVQKQALRNVESPMPTNKGRKNVGTTPELGPPPTKKTKAGTTIITESILRRYKKRMTEIYQHSKQLDEHEVFYGRCNLRVDLFEKEKSDSDDQKPSTSTPTNKSKLKSKSEQLARKQKNRSGHLVKQPNTDCLYIAHTLLNVHNRDPLSSNRPKPGTGKLIWGSCGRKAAASMPENGQPFRIRRLVRHANRAKFLKLRQYMQRSQQQQLLRRIKQEKKEEEERLSLTKEE